ncbi:iron ABC transporter permease [Phaeobacter sp. B1627]|uniref:FecCD family ABC transporter permease n=1 Tax=Phaeobacter sp. B1627 TaxID=2583809 RepID=UPI00111A4C80|nr:iron ABC transporter permease [Phaeobacter sp. B1627]TNJ42744.1 iron ABC transporter permease [Phaeobacter sp. B1627]
MRIRSHSPLLILAMSCGVFLAAFAASLAFGARSIPVATLWQALTAFDPGDPLHGVLRGLRLQRALSGAICGAALAGAGVIMQGLTRNPLADPGLMGVNAGAALAVVAVLWSFGPQDVPAIALAAIIGAGLSAAAVWALAGGQEASDNRALTIRLPLAGTAISSLCLSMVAAVVLLNTETRDLYRFWMVGSLGQATFDTLTRLLPVFAAGVALALAAARGLDALALGHDVAAGLGARPARAAAAALLAVTLLSGGSVALAGPLGFVGLIIPHLVRGLTGSATGLTLVAALPLGAAMVLACDTLGRVAARPSEIAIGLVLAVIGGPAFMVLLSRVLRPAT